MLRLILALALGVAGAGGMNAPVEPTLVGLATWYAGPYLGRPMRNGEVYTGTQMTVAVDASMWAELQGERLLVVDTETGRRVKVLIADSGYLAEYDVVADLSIAAFRKLAPLGRGVVGVRCYLVKEE